MMKNANGERRRTMLFARRVTELTDNEMGEGGKRKQDAKNDGRIEKGLFKPATRVETGAEVVSTESSSKAGSRPLQYDCNDEEGREDNLHIRQYCRDFHAL